MHCKKPKCRSFPFNIRQVNIFPFVLNILNKIKGSIFLIHLPVIAKVKWFKLQDIWHLAQKSSTSNSKQYTLYVFFFFNFQPFQLDFLHLNCHKIVSGRERGNQIQWKSHFHTKTWTLGRKCALTNSQKKSKRKQKQKKQTEGYGGYLKLLYFFKYKKC